MNGPLLLFRKATIMGGEPPNAKWCMKALPLAIFATFFYAIPMMVIDSLRGKK